MRRRRRFAPTIGVRSSEGCRQKDRPLGARVPFAPAPGLGETVSRVDIASIERASDDAWVFANRFHRVHQVGKSGKRRARRSRLRPVIPVGIRQAKPALGVAR